MIKYLKSYPVLCALIFAVAIMALYHLVVGALSTFRLSNEDLNISDFELITLEVVDEDTVITETEDSQMHLQGDILNLYVKCDFSYHPGEFVAFYQDDLDKDFSAEKLIYSRNEGDYYVFNFPLNTKKIRVDIGIFPSITVNFDEITLNKFNAVTLFRLSTSSIFYILLITLVATCIFMKIDTICKFTTANLPRFYRKKR